MNTRQIAEQATIHSFLNCYLRESGQYKRLDAENIPAHLAVQVPQAKQWIHCPLSQQGIDLHIPLRYWSLTGRHLFLFPIFYSYSSRQKGIELDYMTLVCLIAKELGITNGIKGANQDELMLRVILSYQNIEQYVRERYLDTQQLYGFDMEFIDSEQALIFGHLMHPTPKSRQGISEWDAPAYSPELKGKFLLHIFRAHPSIVCQGSASAEMTVDIIKRLLNSDPEISDEFKQQYIRNDGYALLPIHPWQACYLKKKPRVLELMEQGLLEDLGQQGRAYFPTASLRTIYHPDLDFMIKLSLNIKITNSVRANKYQELERGVEVKKLMESEIGQQLKDIHSRFQIICDPAFITLDIDGEKETGFEVILRENPFKMDHSLNATPVAALCQDSIDGNSSRLVVIIKKLAEKEGRSAEEVSMDWFKKYLDISFQPIMWLYFTYGIAVEAHQQNSVIQLKEGYPEQFFYRDNQGYYYCQSHHDKLNQILPGISEKSNTLCSDAIADERLRYYFFFNHLFGLVNAFGTGGLIDERKLLHVLREALESLDIPGSGTSPLISSLLSREQLPCKANLLTRFHDMDELTGLMETQSVYVKIDNPLYRKELIGSGI